MSREVKVDLENLDDFTLMLLCLYTAISCTPGDILKDAPHCRMIACEIGDVSIQNKITPAMVIAYGNKRKEEIIKERKTELESN